MYSYEEPTDPYLEPKLQKISRDYTLSLVAGVASRILVDGSTIYVKSADTTFEVTFNPSGQSINYEASQGGYVGDYDSIDLLSATTQTVIVSLGHGTVTDNRLVASSAVDVVPEVENAILSPAEVSIPATDISLVSAARTTKRETLIRNPLSNTATARIGTGGVTTVQGISLAPGEAISLTGEFAIYGRNTHATVALILELVEMDKV